MVSGFKVVCIIKWFCGGTHEVSNIGEVGAGVMGFHGGMLKLECW